MGRFHAAIFDMDGTLLDTMHIWENLCPDFLRRHHVVPPADLNETVGLMSMHKAVRFLAENFPLGLTIGEAAADIDLMLTEAYTSGAVFKPGAPEFLREVKDRGIIAGILSATSERHVRIALEKIGALELLPGGVMSCEDLRMSKKHPEIFFRMAEHLGGTPETTIVFEDALYAAKTAHEAGFPLCAIYDASEPAQLELTGIADWSIRNWSEFPLAELGDAAD